ncbi:MAG: hypothetical protein RMJ81_08355 [Candidatus Kryptonium sp.]|nr:hypothetical protein [Candidatus Kryptonium sp.]
MKSSFLLDELLIEKISDKAKSDVVEVSERKTFEKIEGEFKVKKN